MDAGASVVLDQRRQSKYIFVGRSRRRGGTAPPQKFFFDLGSQNGDLWCILGAIFAVHLKLWGGEKILSPRYIFIGGNRPPPGDRRHCAGQQWLSLGRCFVKGLLLQNVLLQNGNMQTDKQGELAMNTLSAKKYGQPAINTNLTSHYLLTACSKEITSRFLSPDFGIQLQRKVPLFLEVVLTTHPEASTSKISSIYPVLVCLVTDTVVNTSVHFYLRNKTSHFI